jgi:hypothetical protein
MCRRYSHLGGRRGRDCAAVSRIRTLDVSFAALVREPVAPSATGPSLTVVSPR